MKNALYRQENQIQSAKTEIGKESLISSAEVNERKTACVYYRQDETIFLMPKYASQCLVLDTDLYNVRTQSVSRVFAVSVCFIKHFSRQNLKQIFYNSRIGKIQTELFLIRLFILITDFSYEDF